MRSQAAPANGARRSKEADVEDSRHKAELDQLRAEIDRFDGWILALLRARGEVVMEIARLKRRHGLRSRDPDREEEHLRALTLQPPSPFSSDEVRQIFKAVFHACVRLQDADRPKRSGTHEPQRETGSR